MTQTTQTTANSQQTETSQPTANSQQPTADTTQQATAPQPETMANPQHPTHAVFLSDGKLPQQTNEPKANSQQPTANSQELIAKVTALQARLDAIESQRTTERRTAEVERIIAPLSDTLKAVYRRTPFASLTDEEYTQLTETIKKEVTELATADKARGAVFSRPTASKPTDGKASDKETAEVIRRLNL